MFPPTTTLLSFLSATIIFSVPLSLGNDHEVEFQSGVQEVKFKKIKTGDQNIFPFFGRSKVEIKIQSPGTHEIERIFQKIKSLKKT